MIDRIELATHTLPMTHKNGMQAQIVREPLGNNWVLPGGKRYKHLATAAKAAMPMFEAAGWKRKKVQK